MLRLLFLLGLLAFSILTTRCAESQSLVLHLEPVVTIGVGDDIGEEYLFDFPKQIVADKLGNIYVSEYSSMEVRMFGSDGSYIRTFGAEGAAPGEFRDISAMITTRDNELVIFDRRNDRATEFRSDGTLVHTRQLDLSVDIWDGRQFSDGTFAVNYFSYESAQNGRDAGNHVMHVVDTDYSRVLRSFIGKEDLYNEYDDVPFIGEAWYSMGGIDFTIDTGDNVYVVPVYYDGTIYKYRADENYTRRHVFSEHAVGEKAAEDLDPKQRTAAIGRGAEVARYLSGPDIEYAAIIQRRSAGIAWLANGELLHFYNDNTKEPRLMAEVIDRSGTVLGSTVVWLPDSPDTYVYFALHDGNASGLIYTADNSLGYPVIRTYKVTYELR